MPGGVGGEAAMAPLREARASESLAKRARAAFWLFMTLSMFFTLVAVAAWPLALVGKLIVLALAITPTALAVRARARASKASEDGREALDRAWLAAAEDVTSRAKKGVTVAELATRLKVAPERAEQLLTKLAVNERTRIDVDDDAEVRYSVGPEVGAGATAKVRVDSEDQFRALEEAEAAASGRGVDDEAELRAKLTAPFPSPTSRAPR
jgi:hypothetical protein